MNQFMPQQYCYEGQDENNVEGTEKYEPQKVEGNYTVN
jgi:hypothetical protein